MLISWSSAATILAPEKGSFLVLLSTEDLSEKSTLRGDKGSELV